MSILSTLFGGSNKKVRQKKQICGIVIAVTAALLAISLIVLTVACIAQGINNAPSKETDENGENDAIDIGETAKKELGENAIHSGNLLILNNKNPYKGDAETVNLQAREDRPKTDEGVNSYTVLKADQAKLCATEETGKALNNMLAAFYKAKKDDNIFISGAYNKDKIESQEAIYSSGEAIALSYFHDYANNGINDQRSIAKVDTYSWIYANAHKYGFVALSSSSNIFRYVGVLHATAIKTRGITFDKYMSALAQATPEAPIRLDATHAAYYCDIDSVVLPTEYAYEYSGNNVDGIIVTVDLSKKVAA